MKFIVDAQLPKRLSGWLNDNGHDSIHTLELPLKNRTGDIDIADIADREGRIVISKDGDFKELKLIKRKPKRLLVVSTGNLTNTPLIRLFEDNLVRTTSWN
jgi:predicted nuclease of predicted toxin-antitoxin system